MSRLALPVRRRTSAVPTEANEAARPPLEASAAEQSAPEPAMQWTGGGQLAARVTTATLWLAIVCAPVALVVALSSTGSRTGTATAQSIAPFGEQAAVTDFARSYVVTWLTAGPNAPAALRPFYQGDLSQVTDTSWPVADAAVANASLHPNGTWTITVGVTLASSVAPSATAAATASSAADASQTPAQPSRQYFSVPVAYTAGNGHRAMTALALPAQIPGPDIAAATNNGYTNQLDPASPIAQSAQGFLTSLLTGVGDITRYTTPGVTIAAIAPPPYTSVELIAVDAAAGMNGSSQPPDGALARIRLTVTLTGATHDQLTAQYALALTARAGRWEVTAFDPTPPITLTNPNPYPRTSIKP